MLRDGMVIPSLSSQTVIKWGNNLSNWDWIQPSNLLLIFKKKIFTTRRVTLVFIR